MISKRVKKIPPSGIREFFDLVLGMPDVISLGVGEPDFITPWRIREKAVTVLEEGYTSYTSNKGLTLLRRGISGYLKKKYALSYDVDDEILITVGVSEGLDLALRAVLNPGDYVIVVSPHYVAYPALAELAGAKVLYLETKEKEEFKISLPQLKKLLKYGPKAIILNYPSNPTGVTYTKEELRRIWRLIAPSHAVVITDEIYHDLIYDGFHTPFSALKGAKERTILLNGFSKGSAMTGFRVGFACGPKEVIAAMTKIHSFSMLCAPIVSQFAGVESLRAQREIAFMRREYARRRDFIVKELNRIGLKTPNPQGAFYCFSSIEKTGMDSLSFAKRLLSIEKVAVVPGVAFGASYGNYVRISYANTIDNLKEAIVRIERFVRQSC
ncbi:MAG: aromatic amino acid aminotransferase [Candidatus Omnitrophica bacterium 4484_171]|nr:MAG: aromatic amino acid aminotransferase [Candidatus Omnitrophica bacterium 4484_171]